MIMRCTVEGVGVETSVASSQGLLIEFGTRLRSEIQNGSQSGSHTPHTPVLACDLHECMQVNFFFLAMVQ